MPNKLKLVVVFFGLCTFAQAQINDNCSTATTLSVGLTCANSSASLLNATQSNPPITCNASTAGTAMDVWFKFVATASTASISLNATIGSDIDLVSQLLATCPATATNTSSLTLFCADAFGSGQSETINASALTIGNTYYVRAYHYSNPNQPTQPNFSVCVTSSIATDIHTNLNEIEFSIFPNPSNTGEFEITNITSSDTIEITTQFGQLVHYQITSQSPLKTIITIDGNIQGLLFLKLSNQNSFRTHKLINQTK